MRKFLMTATVIAGTALVAGNALAQGIASVPVTTDSFSAARANSAPPAPGTVTVTLRMQLWTDIGYASDSGNIGKNSSGGTNGSKTGGFQVQEYFRMYPKLDGVAANGLQYGAFAQFRQNNGINGSTSGSSGSSSNLGNTFYVRNAYSYIGLPTVGKLFAGQASMAITQFMVGTLEGIDTNGGWNGDAPDFLSSNTALSWLQPEDGGTYTTNKLVYISPKFAGFDFGGSFEPFYSTGGAAQCGQAGNAAGAGTCSQLTSTPGGAATRRNTYDVAARYTGSFGPAAVVVEGGYYGSGVVRNSTGPTVYKGISLFDVGAQVTAFGFLVGAHYDNGTMSASYQPLHTGAKKQSAIIGGVQYTVGTLTGGIQLIDQVSGGTYTTAAAYKGGLNETGFALGGSWDYASGATAYATVLYGHRHQNNADLLNGGNSAFNNTTNARVFAIGNVFRW
jgi:hypothetical protein